MGTHLSLEHGVPVELGVCHAGVVEPGEGVEDSVVRPGSGAAKAEVVGAPDAQGSLGFS